MGLAAVGGYLRHLREQQRLSREEVASQIRQATATATNAVQVLRIEKGIFDTKSSVLFAFIQAVGGEAEQVQKLLLDGEATEGTGVQLAGTLLQQKQRKDQEGDPRYSLAQFGKTRLFGRMFEETTRDLAHLAPVIHPQHPGRHIYEGTRQHRSGCIVTVDGVLLAEAIGAPAADFEWGYQGKGPAMLANAMLTYEYGAEASRGYSGRFMSDVIAALPREIGGLEWVLDSEEIATWLKLVRLVEQAKQGANDAR